MAQEDKFVRGLGLLDSTMIVAGSMIGSGIFIVSADISRQVGSPGWLMVVWLVTGALTLMAALSFYVLTIAGIFVLRRKRPDTPRPYRAFGYPVIPALYMLGAGIVVVVLFIYQTATTWPGLVIVLTGVPVYFVWQALARRRGIEPEEAFTD